ncbi:MAG: NAD-dependent epimerase/dehydratase family protein [Candidatus Rokuibacteriota bacterium]
MKPILVTGAAGFVGLNVTRVLATRGHRVVALDHRSPDQPVYRFLAGVADRVAWVRGDVRDSLSILQLLRAHGVGRIVHAAAVTATRPDWERERAADLFAVNLLGTIATLQAAKTAEADRVVLVSSGAAVGFGPPDQPVPEEAPATPTELYGISKYAAERAAIRLRELLDLDIIIVRMAQPYGPMERPSPDRAALSPIAEWVESVAAGRPIETPTLDGARDWIYVEDVADAYARLVEAEGLRHVLYNLGPGADVPVREVLDAIRRAWPRAEVVVREELAANPNLAAHRRRGPLEVQRLADELKFQPRFDITSGIARYCRWIDAGRGAPGKDLGP